MAKHDGSVTIGVRSDNKELKSGLKDAEKTTKTSASSIRKDMEQAFEGAAQASGKSSQKLKADVASLAAKYQEQGMTVSESYQQAFQEVMESSAGAESDLVKDAQRIAREFYDSSEASKDAFEDFFRQVEQDSQDARSAFDRLSSSIDEQESELSSLKAKYRDLVLEQGESSDEARDLASQISRLSGELKENKTRMHDAESAADKFDKTLDDTGESAKGAEGGFTVLGGAISSFVGNLLADAVSRIGDLAGSIFELSETTEEYRQLMSKVSGSAEAFGYSIEGAKERYKEFYRYVGDDQMAVNAITNLMGLRVETGTLDKLVSGSIATWTAYGDSIPIESLTEGIAETVNVGKVTGTLADTINWASLTNEQWNGILGESKAVQKAFAKELKKTGSYEDALSAALAATTDKQERANIVAGVLNETYGQSKETYDKLSGSILDANDAELELKETQAELGETLTPLNTKFTQLKNKALKAMSPMVEDVTDSFCELIDDIDWDKGADMIGDVMGVAVDGLEWLLKNIKPVSKLVIGLGTAWATYKGVMAAANVVSTVSNGLMTAKAVVTGTATVAVGAHTVALGTATAAQEAFNIAQMANPIGLIVGLAAGATAAIVAFSASTDDSTRAISENTEKTKELRDEYEELNDQLEESKKQRDESLESTETEYLAADKLTEKLESLAKKENKSNAEKKLMKQYVDQLNEILPELNLQYDEEKDKLNMSTEAIRKNIQATKDLAMAKAAQKNLESIAQDLVEAEMNLAKATEQNKKNQEDLAAAMKERDKAYEAWGKTGYAANTEQQKAFMNALAAVEDLEAAQKESQKTVDDLTKDVHELNVEYDNTEKYAEDMLNSASIEEGLQKITQMCKEKSVEIPKSVSEGIKAGSYKVPESVDGMKALIKLDDITQKAKKSGVDMPKYLSDGIANGSISVQQATESMKALVNFNDLVAKSDLAGKDIPEHIAQKVAEGSLTPKQAVDAMQGYIDFSDMAAKAEAAGAAVPARIYEQVRSGELKPAEAVQMMNDLVTFEDLTKAASDAGIKVPAWIETNIINGKMKPAEAVKAMNRLVSFSGLLEKSGIAGEDVPQEVMEGILNGKLSPEKAIKQMNDIAVKEANSRKQAYNKSGADDVKEKTKGAGSKERAFKNMMAGISASGAAAVIAQTKEFNNAGENVVDGTAVGAENTGYKFRDVMRNIAFGGLSAFKRALGINSPSAVLAYWTEFVPEGAALGVERNKDIAVAAMESMADDMIRPMEDLDGSRFRFGVEEDWTRKMNVIGASEFEQFMDGMRGSDMSAWVEAMQSRAYSFSVPDSGHGEQSTLQSADEEDYKIVLGKGSIVVKADINGREAAHALAPDMDIEIGRIRSGKARGH